MKGYKMRISTGRWYSEFQSGIRIKDYFSFSILDYPILVIRKWDNPHSETPWKSYGVGIFGITFSWSMYIESETED